MQSSSSPSYRDDPSKSKLSRQALSSASPDTPYGRRRGRERAKTDINFNRPAADAPDDLPFAQLGLALKTTHQPAPHLDIASLTSAAEKSSPTTKSTSPVDAAHTPSDPIPIPLSRTRPREDVDCPITPLSARVDSRHFLGRSLKPKYMRSPDNTRHVNHISDDSDSSAGSIKRPQRESTPKSPLSPTMPFSQRFPRGDQAPNPSSTLQSPRFPRFHPANYESPASGAITTPPRSSRPSGHGRQYSDAQQKIHKYQRELVVNATRAARLTLSPKATISPSSPRLHPLGSPGPVTPLALEAEGDYLMARSTGSPASKTSGRELVECLVQQENERRINPHRAESLSPAVSPAGGPQ